MTFAQAYAEFDLCVVERLAVLGGKRLRTDQQDVPHRRDDADDQEGSKLEATTFEMREDRSVDFEHDYDEQDAIHRRSDRGAERLITRERVGDRPIQQHRCEGDENRSDGDIDQVFDRDEEAQDHIGQRPRTRLVAG